jgi:O-antigen/teichoic acid export membrane protein
VHSDAAQPSVQTGSSRLTHRFSAFLSQPLFANAGYLWGVTLVQSFGGFLFWGIAARLYAPEAVGIASATISVVTLLASIAGLGMGMGLIRFLPETQQAGRLLSTTFTFNGLVALLVAGVYIVWLPLWSPSLATLRGNTLYIAGFMAYTVAMTVGNAVRMAFIARRRAGYALAQSGVINGGRLLLVVFLAGMGAAGLVGSAALAALSALILGLVVFLPRVEVGYRPLPALHWRALVVILPFSTGNYLAQLLAQAPQTILPLLILELLGPAASGYAYIAWLLGSILASPGVALASSAFAEGSNAPESLGAILSRSTLAGLAVTGAGALVVAFGAPWLLGLFGTEYAAEAASLLRWLAVAAPLVVLTSLYFTRLRVEKRVGILILLSGMIAVSTLGLAAALMPRYGIAAAGVGWLLGNGLVAALAAGRMWLDRIRRGKPNPQRIEKPVDCDASGSTIQ